MTQRTRREYKLHLRKELIEFLQEAKAHYISKGRDIECYVCTDDTYCYAHIILDGTVIGIQRNAYIYLGWDYGISLRKSHGLGVMKQVEELSTKYVDMAFEQYMREVKFGKSNTWDSAEQWYNNDSHYSRFNLITKV